MSHIETYFRAEKAESLLFMTMGLLAIGFSCYAWVKWGEPFIKGFAIPAVLIGLVQVVVGSTVYFRSDAQTANLQEQLRKDPVAYRTVELPRMEAVMKNFTVYKWIEVLFIVVGLALILAVKSKGFWTGIGVGMLLQGAVMLAFDQFAEKRGEEYMEFVRLEGS